MAAPHTLHGEGLVRISKGSLDAATTGVASSESGALRSVVFSGAVSVAAIFVSMPTWGKVATAAIVSITVAGTVFYFWRAKVRIPDKFRDTGHSVDAFFRSELCR